jgi:hypothetical protein
MFPSIVSRLARESHCRTTSGSSTVGRLIRPSTLKDDETFYLDQFPDGLVHKQHLNHMHQMTSMSVRPRCSYRNNPCRTSPRHVFGHLRSKVQLRPDGLYIQGVTANIRSYCIANIFDKYVLYTDIGRQDVAIGNYRVQVVRVIDCICFSATVEHGTGKRGVQDAEPNFATNTDAELQRLYIVVYIALCLYLLWNLRVHSRYHWNAAFQAAFPSFSITS